MAEIRIPSEQDIYALRHKTASQLAVLPSGTHLSLFLGAYYNPRSKEPMSYFLSTPDNKGWPKIQGSKLVLHKMAFDNESIHEITDYEETKQIGIRPMMSKADIPTHIQTPSYFDKESNCQILEYGFYPQTCINYSGENDISKQLNQLYKAKKGLTGRFYTFNYHSPLNNKMQFYPREFDEYQLDDSYYIRFQPNFRNYPLRISEMHQFWIKVEPIKWLYNQTTGNLIAKQILLGGIAIHNNPLIDYYGKFQYTQLHQYLNKYFNEEITQHSELTHLKGLSLTDYKNMIVEHFKDSSKTTYKDNRVQFYQDFFAKTKQFTQQIEDNQTLTNEVNNFAKEFVRYMMRHNDLTPSYAVSQLNLELQEDKEKQPNRYPQKITRQRFKPTFWQWLGKYNGM